MCSLLTSAKRASNREMQCWTHGNKALQGRQSKTRSRCDKSKYWPSRVKHMLQAVIADMVAAHPRYRAPNAVPHIDEGGRVVNVA